MGMVNRIKRASLRKRLVVGSLSVVTLMLLMFAGGMWSATGKVLSPSFLGLTKDLSVCPSEAAGVWGKSCGNLRQTKQYRFSEIKVPVDAGYQLPGWLVTTKDNGMGDARGAILLVHSGGSDRREDTKYLPFMLGQELDVLTFDLSCSGEAPCPGHGLTYGYRESRDIIAAYNYLHKTHDVVYVMGASMGATSVLTALPELEGVAGVIAENPMYGFERLIREAPESKSMPAPMTSLFIRLAKFRGGFDDSRTPAKSLTTTSTAPILFMHSKTDAIVSYKQTQDLAVLYKGQKTAVLFKTGKHSEFWNTNRAAYESALTAFLR